MQDNYFKTEAMSDISAITYTADPIKLVAKVDGEQMGVTVQLGGITNWLSYIDDQLEQGLVDEEDRQKYESEYDGYLMLWGFDTSAIVVSEDGAIDAGCISSAHGGGGYCAGVKYIGDNNRSPYLWAQWSS